jgi:DNA invertase Pin-like site-specific DNA recombinase
VRDLCELTDRCKREGWSLMSVGEQIDTSSAAGRMVVNILGVIGQWERETIGERTAAALQHKRSRGEFTGGKVAPYGYRLSADGVRIEPEPREQDVVAAARGLHADGLGCRRISLALERRGMVSRTGRPFADTQIARMLG